jgi:hypothetical protein
MLDDHEGPLHQFDLLDNAPLVQWPQPLGVGQLVRDDLIDLFGRERRALVLGMAELSAAFAFAFATGPGGGGLTMSLLGGLEELEEFFLSRAISSSSLAIRSVNRRMIACNWAMLSF